ncbi:MAG: hypothetical protein ACHQTE_02620 [Candidatus Saccharimonadales bacterium]
MSKKKAAKRPPHGDKYARLAAQKPVFHSSVSALDLATQPKPTAQPKPRRPSPSPTENDQA